MRTLLSLAVWGVSAAGAIWLHRQGAGGGDVVALAEMKEHKVAPSELGRLVSLEVAEGQRVTEGQVVARLETEIIQREISVAEARRQQASSEVRATGASLDASLLQAGRAFQSEVEAAEIEIQAAQSAFAREKAELARVNEDLGRQHDLVRRGLAKADRLPELELRRTTLSESVGTWPARIQVIQARLESARLRMTEWRRANTSEPGGSRQARLQPVYDKVREQDESIRLLKTHLRNTVLRATCGGYVSGIYARPGDVLRAGDPILTLVEAHPRQIVAYVEEHRDAPLAVGSRVTARRRLGGRERYEGTVAAVSAQVSQLPARLWTHPNLPAWGRAVYIQLPAQASLDPGEAVDVLLPRRAGGGSPQRAASTAPASASALQR